MRLNELNVSKTDLRNKMDAIEQILSHIEEEKDQVELKVRKLKTIIKIVPKENPFAFTEYVEKKREYIETDLGLFFELAEENETIYNQTPINILIQDMEKLNSGFFTNSYFNLGDEGEIDTIRFFKDSNELAEFIDQI